MSIVDALDSTDPVKALSAKQGKILKDMIVAASGSAVTSSIVASSPISAFAAVTANGSTADSSNVTHADKVIGVSPTAINTGFSGLIVSFGEIENLSWSWTAGAPIYLNGTSLSMITPSSGFVLQVGKAKTPTIMIVDIDQSILL